MWNVFSCRVFFSCVSVGVFDLNDFEERCNTTLHLHETLALEIQFARVPHTIRCHHLRQHIATNKRTDLHRLKNAIVVCSRTGCFTLNTLGFTCITFRVIYNSIKYVITLEPEIHSFCTVFWILFSLRSPSLIATSMRVFSDFYFPTINTN